MAALRTILLLLLAALGAPTAIAAEVPSCTADTSGTVACIAERLCRCDFRRGGSMVDRAAGYRWDCGPLRPNCHRPPAQTPRPTQPFSDLNLLVPFGDMGRPGGLPAPTHPLPRPLQLTPR
jgi:hypothetical protein